MEDNITYRRALGAFPTGVALIAANGPHGPLGIIVNSFTSVSLKPRLVLWCLGVQSDRYGVFSAAERWSVNVLSADQQAISQRFARAGSTEGDGAAFRHHPYAPVLEGALTTLVCRTLERSTLGDHLVIVGEVEAFETCDGDALTYFRGRYGRATMES